MKLRPLDNHPHKTRTQDRGHNAKNGMKNSFFTSVNVNNLLNSIKLQTI